MDLTNQSDLFDFRYRIDHLAGQGGMGQVYYAFDCWNDDLPVALKALFNSSGSYQKLLKQEIGAVRHLQHPSIARILGGGFEEANRTAFVVSEWADGVDASKFVWSEQNDKLQQFILAVLHTLVYIHSHGIIHHDLKPANCHVYEENDSVRIKLLDFGLAGRKRKRKNVRGTVDYLPPEQWRSPFTSPAIDLYALGIMAYQCATGHTPFPELSPVQSVRKRGETAIPDARQETQWLSPEIAELITLLTDPNPNYRPNTASEALNFLLNRIPIESQRSNYNYFRDFLEFQLPNAKLTAELNGYLDSNAPSMRKVVISGELVNCDADKQLNSWMMDQVYNGIPSGKSTGEEHAAQTENWFTTRRNGSSKAILLNISKHLLEPVGRNSKYITVSIASGETTDLRNYEEDRISISPRDFTETKSFIKNLIPGIQAPDSWFQKIYFTSGGYGRLIRKRLFEEFQRGTLVQNGDGWSIQPFEPTLVIADDLQSVYDNQLKDLKENEQLLLKTLSLFPHGLPLHQLLAITRLTITDWNSFESNPLVTRSGENEIFVEIGFLAFRYLLYSRLEPAFVETIYNKVLKLKETETETLWVLSAAIHCCTLLNDRNGVGENLTIWFERLNRERLRYDTLSTLSRWIEDESVPNELRAMIGLRWGLALALLGDAKLEERVYELVLNLIDISKQIRIPIQNRLAILLLQRGQILQAKKIFTMVFEEATDVSQLDLKATALSALSWIAVMNQEWQTAEELSEKALRLTRNNEVSFERYRALNVKAMSEYFIKRNYEAASKTWRTCLHIANALDHQTWQCDALNNLGVVAALKGKNTTASRYWNRTIGIARSIDYRPRLSAALVNVGIKHFEAGRLDEALVSYEQGLRLFQRTERLAYQVDCLMNRSELNLCRALYTDALNDNEQARNLAMKANDSDQQLQTWFQYSEILFMVGSTNTALEALDRSDVFLSSSSPQAANRSKILRNRLNMKNESLDLSQLSQSGGEDNTLDPIEEARSLFIQLFANTSLDNNIALVLSKRLLYIGNEHKHDWYRTWGEFYLKLFQTDDASPSDWETILHQSKKYPELYWRIFWQQGNTLVKEGNTEQGKIVYRKALNTLKSIGMGLNKAYNESYFSQEHQRNFRADVLAANK